jgi:hypothetical protein
VRTNERGVVADWILKLVIGLALVGVVLFDVGSILVNFFTLDSTANDMATSLTTSIASREINATPHDVELQAEELAKELGVRLVRAEVDPDGKVFIKLKRTADTLIVRHIGAIEDWAVATADARRS